MNSNRQFWIDELCKMARPVLQAATNRKLKKIMPVEAKEDRSGCTYLEAVGRLLAGMAPWLELTSNEYGDLARSAIAAIIDPKSPDYVLPPADDELPRQILVDCAFLSHALLRAPRELFEKLDSNVQTNLLALLYRSRQIFPNANNWLLFTAMVETALLKFTGHADMMRINFALKLHDEWFKGDGVYGDGPSFAQDYYNSFVIQSMLLDIAAAINHPRHDVYLKRAQRYAEIQERMIMPDGSFPVTGRSLTYRCGAFQLLAQLALSHKLPDPLPPGQIRSAMQAVIKRTLNAPDTYNEAGFLQIGLCGHQPSIGESYISTGSLYLASTAFLPLGLPANNPFWTAPETPWTNQKVWSGADIIPDHPVKEI